MPASSCVAAEIGDETGNVDHDIEIEKAGGDFRIENAARARAGFEIVDDGEIVRLGLLTMHGEGVGYVDGGVGVGVGIGSHHAAE